MDDELNITICNSLNEENVFFIFRDTGVEIKIKIEDAKVYTLHKLKETEKAYLNNYIIKK